MTGFGTCAAAARGTRAPQPRALMGSARTTSYTAKASGLAVSLAKSKLSSLRMPSVVFGCDQRHTMPSQIGSLLRLYWGTIRWPSWRCCGGPVILPRPWKCSSCSNFGRPSGRLILSACFYFPSGGATPTLQRNAAYFCLSFARMSLAWLFALGRVLT